MSDEIRYLGDVQRLALQDDDVVVLTVNRHLTSSDKEFIFDLMTKTFTGHPVLILDEGFEISVVGESLLNEH